MKRIIAAMAALVLSIGCYAQDMIVKKDGSIIQAKVSEIGTSEVKYKKWSNQDGPSYAIAKSDILAITYQNGEKETFETADSPSQQNAGQTKSSLNEYATLQKNIDQINLVNNAPFSNNDPKFVGKKKSAKYVGVQYGITQNSVVSTDVLSVQLEIGRVRDEGRGEVFSGQPIGIDKTNVNYVLRTGTLKKISSYFTSLGYPAVLFALVNNSDKVMYVDLANTFLTKGQIAEPYYVPTATTTSTTSSSGGSFNLGGITNGLGIGGVAGSLANATTIGGSHGTTTSNVLFSQRIISIPPHSSITLPYKSIEDNGFISQGTHYGMYMTDFQLGREINIGEEVLYNESNSPFKFTFFATIAFDEGMSNPLTSTTTIYCKKVLGVDNRNGWFIYIHDLDYSRQGLYSFGHTAK